MTISLHRAGDPQQGRLSALLCAALSSTVSLSAQCPQGAEAPLVAWSGVAGYLSPYAVDDESLSQHAIGFWFPMPNPNGSGIPTVFDEMWVGSNGEIYLTVSSSLLTEPVGGSAYGCSTANDIAGVVAGGSARVVPFGSDLMRSRNTCNIWQVAVDNVTSPTAVTVTWTDVARYTTGISTDAFRFACTLHANGDVDLSYGTTFPIGTNLCAVGLSTGNLIAGPASNLSAAATSTNGLLYEEFTFDTFDLAGTTLHIAMNVGLTGYTSSAAVYVPPTCASHCASGVGCYNDPINGVYPLTLSAVPRPVRDPNTGVNFDYTIANVPEVFPCAGLGIAAVVLSIGLPIPGVNLDFLGMPDCFAHVPTLDYWGPTAVQVSTPCVPYMTVSPYPASLGALPVPFDFSAQAFALVLPPSPLMGPPYNNTFGLLTSNVVHSHVEWQ